MPGNSFNGDISKEMDRERLSKGIIRRWADGGLGQAASKSFRGSTDQLPEHGWQSQCLSAFTGGESRGLDHRNARLEIPHGG